MKLAASLKLIFDMLLFLVARIDPLDVVALVGLGLVTAGARMIYAPLGLIVPGAVFFLIGVRARHSA